MDVIEALMTRRSVRKFLPDPVPEALLEKILRAAMAAPSAGNRQPWQFVVMNDRQMLDAVSVFHPHAAFAKEAPLGILVCGDTTHQDQVGYWVQDCSAAVQNILLAAHGLGLGAVWAGVYPREERMASFSKLVNLPAEIIPMAFLALGYPNQELEKVDRYKPERIHTNGY